MRRCDVRAASSPTNDQPENPDLTRETTNGKTSTRAPAKATTPWRATDRSARRPDVTATARPTSKIVCTHTKDVAGPRAKHTASNIASRSADASPTPRRRSPQRRRWGERFATDSFWRWPRSTRSTDRINHGNRAYPHSAARLPVDSASNGIGASRYVTDAPIATPIRPSSTVEPSRTDRHIPTPPSNSGATPIKVPTKPVAPRAIVAANAVRARPGSTTPK